MQGALCIMYSISNFYFTFYLFRGVVHTQRTPCLRACAMYSIVSPWLVTSWRGVTHSHEMIVWMYIIVVIADRLCVLNLQIKSGNSNGKCGLLHYYTGPFIGKRKLISIFLHYLVNGRLGSRVVSVLDSGAVGPGFKSQQLRNPTLGNQDGGTFYLVKLSWL